MTPAETLGARVRRHRSPYVQTSVAQAMVSRGHTSWRQQTLAKVENDQRNLTLLEAVDLAAVLECRLEDFLSPEEQRAAATTPREKAMIEGRDALEYHAQVQALQEERAAALGAVPASR